MIRTAIFASLLMTAIGLPAADDMEPVLTGASAQKKVDEKKISTAAAKWRRKMGTDDPELNKAYQGLGVAACATLLSEPIRKESVVCETFNNAESRPLAKVRELWKGRTDTSKFIADQLEKKGTRTKDEIDKRATEYKNKLLGSYVLPEQVCKVVHQHIWRVSKGKNKPDKDSAKMMQAAGVNVQEATLKQSQEVTAIVEKGGEGGDSWCQDNWHSFENTMLEYAKLNAEAKRKMSHSKEL